MLNTQLRGARPGFGTKIGVVGRGALLGTLALATALLSQSAQAQLSGLSLARGLSVSPLAELYVSTRAAEGRRVKASAYNSLPSQTQGNPFITATGTRTRPGVLAVSRDLLSVFPYGTRVRLEDPTGRMSHFLQGRIFTVEDTMHPRMTNKVDIWMESRHDAIQWGVRDIVITPVR